MPLPRFQAINSLVVSLLDTDDKGNASLASKDSLATSSHKNTHLMKAVNNISKNKLKTTYFVDL